MSLLAEFATRVATLQAEFRTKAATLAASFQTRAPQLYAEIPVYAASDTFRIALEDGSGAALMETSGYILLEAS